MTLQNFLNAAVRLLTSAGVETARLDCLILLEDALGQDRALLLAHPEIVIDAPKITILNKQITQRQAHVPLAYIRGKAQFYGREFEVNEHVLVPRPETETMIEMLISLSLPANTHLADVGTGTGCIGITAALEVMGSKVTLLDASKLALDMAKRNARSYNVQATFVQADLLTTITRESFDMICANLPYVPNAYPVNEAAKHEPALALFAGADGLDLYRSLWQQIAKLAKKPANILAEALPMQHAALAAIAKNAGYIVADTNDFIQRFIKT
jgi:release factor glutamine methyltransferase